MFKKDTLDTIYLLFKRRKYWFPSIQEQNKISDLIKQLEDNIELNSNTIVLLKKLKEFLLQNMFL